MASIREGGGARITLVGATLGLVAAAGLGVVIWIGTAPPERSLSALAFPLVWATPALLALLSLRSRPVLLVPAAVLGFLLAFTAFSGVTLVLLVPTVCYALAYRRRLPRPMAPARTALAVVVPVLATAGAFIVLLAHPDPRCWTYVEDANGNRTYTTIGDTDCDQEMGGRIPPAVVTPPPPGQPGHTTGPEIVASGGGSTSDSVSPVEAAGAASLLVAGLAVAWTASAGRHLDPP